MNKQQYNPYTVLNIKEEGTFNTAEIRKAYKNLAKIHHPDKFRGT